MIMRFLNRWRRDNRGVSAVEFAFIAPILILAYFGVAELCGAMLQQRKAGHVASEVGDLFAQCQTYADSDFTNFWSVGDTLMYPLDTSTLSMRLTLISNNSTGTQLSVPSDGSHATGAALSPIPAGPYTDPSGTLLTLIPANGQIVMSDTVDTYNSPVSIVVKNAMTFSSTFYLTPRQSTSIPAGAACTS
jgi:Flp pilus assembly protein TadG